MKKRQKRKITIGSLIKIDNTDRIFIVDELDHYGNPFICLPGWNQARNITIIFFNNKIILDYYYKIIKFIKPFYNEGEIFDLKIDTEEGFCHLCYNKHIQEKLVKFLEKNKYIFAIESPWDKYKVVAY